MPHHCILEGVCNHYSPPFNNECIPCDGKNKDTGNGCLYDNRTNDSRAGIIVPSENQILVTFRNKEIVNYILLVSRRKGYDLGDYIEGNFEWDDMLPCIDKINPEDCQFCDFREQCPDRVGGA
jgi:hypothetical protein